MEANVKSVEAMQTATAFLDQQDADVVRIAESKKADHQAVTTPSQNADDASAPRRRSVLQKATVKTSPECTAESAMLEPKKDANPRIAMSPACLSNQVLVKDLKSDPPSNEAFDSDSPGQQRLSDRNLGDAPSRSMPIQRPQVEMIQAVESAVLGSDASTSYNNILTTQTNRITQAKLQSSSNGEARQRPKTTNASQPSRVVSEDHPVIQNCASQAPRQVIFRNGTGTLVMSQSNNSWQKRGNKTLTKSSKQNVSGFTNADLSHVVASSNQLSPLRGNQSVVVQRLEREPTRFKGAGERMTFTQGVSELIKNFDKKFIVENVSLPQPPTDLVKAQQKQIVDRNAIYYAPTTETPQYLESNVVTANLNAQLKTVPSMKETATRTITQDDTSRPISYRADHGPGANRGGLLTSRAQLVNAQPRPGHVTASTGLQKSPIQQKTFDTDGLTQVQSTILGSPHLTAGNQIYTYHQSIVGSSPQTTGPKPKAPGMPMRASLNSQTTVATLHQKQGRRFSKPASPATVRGAMSTGQIGAARP